MSSGSIVNIESDDGLDDWGIKFESSKVTNFNLSISPEWLWGPPNLSNGYGGGGGGLFCWR
jgi:hypothetical protein